MTDTETDLDKMYRVFTAPDAPQADEPDDDDADDSDVLFAADMTTKELQAKLAPMLRDAIAAEWQKALARVNAPSAPTATTKGKRITFKG